MKNKNQGGRVLAHRDLEFVQVSGNREPTRVSLFMPEPDETEDHWWCECLIESPSFRKPFRIAGGDSIQALTLALTTIPAELERLSQRNGGTFYFLGEPGHEFPTFAHS